MTLREMDNQVTYARQLRQDDGPVVLINQFNPAPEDARHFLQVWADDAAFMKAQPGFIYAELAVAGPGLAGISREFEHVLTGIVLHGAAARLARMLDPAFLAEAGWDPAARVLSLPAGHRLMGRTVCRAAGA